MKHGTANEKLAIAEYERLTGQKVEHLGFIILPQMPWAGFSPDGIVSDEKLIEVKCPLIGQERTASEVAKEVKFTETENGEIKLRKRHPYYAQIQLGMAICNVNKCDFVIYASYDKSCFIIAIPLDINFLTLLLIRLKCVYFQHKLPYLISKK